MKRIITFLFLTVFFVQLGMAQTNEEKAKEKGAQAATLINGGQFDEAINLLKEAEKLDPNSIVYPYEQANALFKKEDYKSAIDLLRKLRNHAQVTDSVYDLLAKSNEKMKRVKDAYKTYEDGMRKFPASGILYYGIGELCLKDQDYERGLALFEKGVEMDPTYAPNYYWASKLFLTVTDEAVWGIVYGEMFLTLELSGQRVMEISKAIYDAYKKGITIEGGKASVAFSKETRSKIKGDMKGEVLPFGKTVFEPLLVSGLEGATEINIQTLSKARSKFAQSFADKSYEEDYSIPLFVYQKKVLDAGHMEAYNYWVLMYGNMKEYMTWKASNEEAWNAFVEWYANNPIVLDNKNKFIR